MWPDNNRNVPISVDGTHFRIHEPKQYPSAQWYSHKFKGPGLSYEIALSIHESQIAWSNGPFPAGVSDIEVFRQPNGLMDKLADEGKYAIADGGYEGEQDFVLTRNPLDDESVKEVKKRAKARQETVNARLKGFEIMNGTYRHDIFKHRIVFNACLVLVQFDLENGHPLWEI